MPSAQTAAQTKYSAEGVVYERGPAEAVTLGGPGPGGSDPDRPVGAGAGPHRGLRTLRAVTETGAEGELPGDFEPDMVRELNRTATRQQLLPQRRQIARDRSALFMKSQEGPLTRREEATLRYLEWQLDRIEDAAIGEGLDRLAEMAAAHETLAKRVSGWLRDMKKLVPGPSKHKGRK